MFEFLKRKKDSTTNLVPEYVSPPDPTFRKVSDQTPQLIVPGFVILGTRKWVKLPSGEIGIVTGLDNSGYVRVDITDSQGLTIKNTRVPVGAVKLAKYLEIPANRRGDQAVAATLGYV